MPRSNSGPPPQRTDGEIDADAKIVWEYLRMKQEPKVSDAIFVLCSMDIRVAERGAELYLNGYGKYVVVSGGSSNSTKDVFDEPEAEVFARAMRLQGVPTSKIVVESASTNTGENVRFTYELLTQRSVSPRSLVLVQKPYMVRRSYATFKKQWPDAGTTVTVTSPSIEYEKYFDDTCPKELVLSVMAGDM